jgi:preprotein translocase subunit SecE
MLSFAKFYKFYDEVKAEVLKVTWPTRKELVTSTIVIVVTIAIVSLVCLVADLGIHKLMQFLLRI